jgi:hypothetical protein
MPRREGRSPRAGSNATRFGGGGGAARAVSFVAGRTEICGRRVLPGTAGSSVAGLGRMYIRGCSDLRLVMLGRTDSRGRCCGASTVGRMPELLPLPFGYDEMTGSSVLAAELDAGSDADDSPEAIAPPSELPKILVRSPNVEFLALSLSRAPRPARSRCQTLSRIKHVSSNATSSRSGGTARGPCSRVRAIPRVSVANYHGCYARREKVWIAVARKAACEGVESQART